MFERLRRILRDVRSARSGNATMMVAIGVPALIGGSGLAVDMSQWYMWKRELQYAVDQAALAGAFARLSEDTEDDYSNRAIQEFSANMAVASGAATTPNVILANYNGGSNNSVIVRAQVSDTLPFSSFVTGRGVVIDATAQASFRRGAPFTSCIIAVDEEEEGAITIGGSVRLAARCGIAALSNAAEAVTINGNPEVDPGWVVARGGIDDWLSENTDAEIHEYVDDLTDPFADLTPPNDPTERTYSKNQDCKSGTNTTTTGTETTTTTVNVYTGDKKNQMTLYSSTVDGPVTQNVNRPAYKHEQSGQYTVTDTDENWDDRGNSQSPRYIMTQTTTTIEKNVTVSTSQQSEIATINPGTYSDLSLQCDTVLNPGIYVIDGGNFETNAQYSVQGNGVMFVLKNGAGMRINGGASINLTAMTTSQLLNVYADPPLDAATANGLEGMLFFEDRSSSGNNGNLIAGNANTVLNGTIYMPVSAMDFRGTITVTSQCLMIAANTISLLGNVNMETFCPPGMFEDTTISSGAGQVRLVA